MLMNVSQVKNLISVKDFKNQYGVYRTSDNKEGIIKRNGEIIFPAKDYMSVIALNDHLFDLTKEDFTPIFVSEILDIEFSDAFDVLKIYSQFCNSNLKSIKELKSKYIPKRTDSFEYAELFYEKIKNKEIECNHSFYLKEFELSQIAKTFDYDYVLLDEAQDTNPVTLSIFNQLSGAKILVGDTHQTIYQFRDSVNAMEIISSDYTCYLSTTYRCNEKVVKYANVVLSKIRQKLLQEANHY